MKRKTIIKEKGEYIKKEYEFALSYVREIYKEAFGLSEKKNARF